VLGQKLSMDFALRSFEREPAFDELDPDFKGAGSPPDPENALIEQERNAALVQAIRDLSPQQQNCIHLRVRVCAIGRSRIPLVSARRPLASFCGARPCA
jgi:hypothetical protein